MSSSHNILFTLLLTVALVLASCNRKAIYSHYEATPVEGWSSSDTLHFELGPVFRDGTYQEMLNLRTTSAYPFTDLTVVVHQKVLPSGKESVDTLSITLDKSQKTTIRHHSLSLDAISLTADERIAVSIHHYMKKESLPGITDVGMCIDAE